MPPTIPTVDIAPWLDLDAPETARQHVVDVMRDACTTYGFFNLVGHGVAPAQRQEILDCARLFFTLPEDEKMKVWIGQSVGRSFRGYEPPGIQTHQEGLLPDTKEVTVLHHRPRSPPTDPKSGTFSTGPNLWPAALPAQKFREPILRYQATMVTLVQTLLRILACGLPAEWHCAPDVLDALAQNRPSIPMRLLHYAPQAVQSDRQFGVGDHTDFGCITILLQELGTQGLEVWYPPTETWIPVPPVAGAYVINIGDMLQRFTAGYYRSARHRVVTAAEGHRYSVPFFLNGQLGLRCAALDGSGVETVVGEHIRGRLIETMGVTGERLR